MGQPPPPHMNKCYPHYREMNYRGANAPHSSPGPPDEETHIVVPAPIIKKEALEGFEEPQSQTETWATSNDDVDYK